uniref:Uncharacterized protein n=1 Tax=Hordeum vulgare subsp. vulgare TaxID=112509 RepID=A0A8I6XI18_HORVV
MHESEKNYYEDVRTYVRITFDNMNLRILYHCPAGVKSTYLCFFSRDGKSVIRASLKYPAVLKLMRMHLSLNRNRFQYQH